MRLGNLRTLLVGCILTGGLTLMIQGASPAETASVKTLALNSSGKSLEARIATAENSTFK